MARSKFKRTWTGSFIQWVNVLGVIGGLIALIATCVNYLNNQMTSLDRRTYHVEEAIKRIDVTLVEIKTELKKTSDLLNADLSWRYLYQNDPTRKHLALRYHPETRTLEFVDTTTSRRDSVRKP